jgi:hypothetical protein
MTGTNSTLAFRPKKKHSAISVLHLHDEKSRLVHPLWEEVSRFWLQVFGYVPDFFQLAMRMAVLLDSTGKKRT